jgi:hypothetical protein
MAIAIGLSFAAQITHQGLYCHMITSCGASTAGQNSPERLQQVPNKSTPRTTVGFTPSQPTGLVFLAQPWQSRSAQRTLSYDGGPNVVQVYTDLGD